MQCAIQGIGVVTPAGITIESLAELQQGTGGVADVQPLEQFYTKRELRRTSQYCRLALLGANLALQDAGMSVDAYEAGRLGIIVATGYGPARTTFDFLDSIHDFGAKLASPLAFSTSVHNIAASMLSIRLGSTGPCLSVNQFETSFASALLSAQCWLAEGRVDAILVGAVDEYDAILANAVSAASGCMADVDSAADGSDAVCTHTPPAEGAVFMLLTREAGTAEAPKRGVLGPVGMQRHQNGEPAGKCILPAGQALEVAMAVADGASGTIRCADASCLESAIVLGGAV